MNDRKHIVIQSRQSGKSATIQALSDVDFTIVKRGRAVGKSSNFGAPYRFDPSAALRDYQCEMLRVIQNACAANILFPQNQTNKTNQMNNQLGKYTHVAIARPTLVFGTDVSTLDEPQTIRLIRQYKEQRAALDDIADSKRLSQRQAKLDEVVTVLVAHLDTFTEQA